MIPDPSLLASSSRGPSADIPSLSPAESRSPAVSAGESPIVPKRTPLARKKLNQRKMYKVVMAAVALRAQGFTFKEISAHFGYAEDTVKSYLKRANKEGWINSTSFPCPDDQLEFILKSKTVRNLEQFLDDRDKLVTIETAKGVGLFKQHQVVKGEGTTNVGVALRVQVELPPAAASNGLTIRPGTIGGARAIDVPLDAEVIDAP